MIEDQTILVQGVLYAVHPVHLAGAVGNRIVVTLIDVDTVAAFVFGDIAGRVGGAKDLVPSDVADRHQPEVAADTEVFVVPLEAQRRERLPRSTTCAAEFSGQRLSSMANSSPPIRASRSASRINPCKVHEVCLSSSSPARCPPVSFISLN